MILVVGATGTTGTALVDGLVREGVPARALVRGPMPRPGLDDRPGVDVVRGDARDPASLRAALAGVDQVFLAMSNGPGQLDHELAVVTACSDAGIGHLVKVSAPVVGPDVPVAVARLHFAVERAVLDAGLPYTFLRPYTFQQNLLGIAGLIADRGFFTGVAADAPFAMIDARDIADVALVALTTTRTRNRALVLTGPEAVSYPEVARRLTALGRPTRYLDLPEPEYRAALGRAGLPPWIVEHLVEIQRLAVSRPERPNDVVAEVTGRAPRSLDAFLAENAHRFGAGRTWSGNPPNVSP